MDKWYAYKSDVSQTKGGVQVDSVVAAYNWVLP